MDICTSARPGDKAAVLAQEQITPWGLKASTTEPQDTAFSAPGLKC